MFRLKCHIGCEWKGLGLRVLGKQMVGILVFLTIEGLEMQESSCCRLFGG